MNGHPSFLPEAPLVYYRSWSVTNHYFYHHSYAQTINAYQESQTHTVTIDGTSHRTLKYPILRSSDILARLGEGSAWQGETLAWPRFYTSASGFQELPGGTAELGFNEATPVVTLDPTEVSMAQAGAMGMAPQQEHL